MIIDKGVQGLGRLDPACFLAQFYSASTLPVFSELWLRRKRQ